MTHTPGTVEAEGHLDGAAPDRGCRAWSRCTTCPFTVCIADLSARERTELHAALRVVYRYLAEPERVPLRA
jgi:hypothetical protein